MLFKYVFGKVKRYQIGEEKSRFRKIIDLIKWQIRERDFNRMYYAFGLNVKGKSLNEYMGRREFLKKKGKWENEMKRKMGAGNLEYDVVTKDKFVFNCFLKANNIPCPKVYGIIKNNIFIDSNSKEIEIEKFLNINSEFVLKNITLEASEGVFVCKVNEEFIKMNEVSIKVEEFKQKLIGKICIVQKIYYSHRNIRQINSSALNTTRIVTVMKNSKPGYLTGFQSFATGNASTDSWDKGSVYVGIDVENECLKKYGYFNLEDKNNSITEKHPDSGIIFKGYEIPYLKDAVDLCIKTHNLLYFNFIIGWDVAITDGGPVMIEANEKPGMNVVQCVDGGLKAHLNNFFKIHKFK